MNFKRCKVVMLATNEKVIKKGELMKATFSCNNPQIKKGELALCVFPDGEDRGGWMSQHLYILSDDFLEVGDWSITCVETQPEPFRVDCELQLLNIRSVRSHNPNAFLKIIATTNPKLNASVWDNFHETITKGMEDGKLPKPDSGGLPKPSKAFIQKYVKLNGIDEVMVEYTDEIPKISKNNSITIRPIDNKSRESIETFFYKKYEEAYKNTKPGNSFPTELKDYQLEWIKEFLKNI